MCDKGSDGGERGGGVSINKRDDLVEGLSFQTTDGVDYLSCFVTEPVVIDFQLHPELGDEAGELCAGAIEFLRVGELFRAEGGGGGSSNWGGGDGDGCSSFGGATSGGEVEIKGSNPFFQRGDFFMSGGEVGAGGVSFVAEALDEGGDMAK